MLKLENKALFIIAPAIGHVRPAVILANELQIQNEYDCVFTSTDEFKEEIQNNNLEFYAISTSPFGRGNEGWKYEQKPKRQFFADNLILRISNYFFFKRTLEFKKILDQFSPKLIVLDSYFSTDFIILYPLIKDLDIKVVLLQSIFTCYKISNNPPLNSRILPNEKLKISLQWIYIFTQRIVSDYYNKIKYIGYDNYSMIIKKYNLFNIKETNKIVRSKTLQLSFENIEEWILLPKEFEFKEIKFHKNQRYIGLCINKEIQPFEEITRLFIHNSRLINSKIVLAVLGSLHEVHTNGKSLFFFKKLIHIAKNDLSRSYIIVVGHNLISLFNSEELNILILPKVPQFTLLKDVQLFITHGGPSSIMESVYQLCPMLVFPLNNIFDQNGNAVRVEYHGLGKIMHLNDSEIKISRAIDTIFDNYDFYKRNLILMKEKIDKPINLSSLNI